MTAGNMLLSKQPPMRLLRAHDSFFRPADPRRAKAARDAGASRATRSSAWRTGFQVLAAVDWENVQRFHAEIPLDENSLVIGRSDQGDPPEVFLRSGPRPGRACAQAAREVRAGGSCNMVLLARARGADRVAGRRRRSARSNGRWASARRRSRRASPAVAAGRTAAGRDRGAVRARRSATEGRATLAAHRQRGRGLTGPIKAVCASSAAYPITPATDCSSGMSPALAQVGGTLVAGRRRTLRRSHGDRRFVRAACRRSPPPRVRGCR